MKNSLTAKVLKVIGVFSGAEAFGIICSVVKMKLVAMWLSATGVGLFGLFGTTVDTVSIITGLGLRQVECVRLPNAAIRRGRCGVLPQDSEGGACCREWRARLC